jgi:hypothetical protein
MAFEQGYNVTEYTGAGKWPHETYRITPVIGNGGNFFNVGSDEEYYYASEIYYLNNPSIKADYDYEKFKKTFDEEMLKLEQKNK